MVQVKKRALGAFKKNILPVVYGIVKESRRVCNEPNKPFTVHSALFKDFISVNLFRIIKCRENLVFVINYSLYPGPERFKVTKITHPDRVTPAHFIGITWPNTTGCCADLVLT